LYEAAKATLDDCKPIIKNYHSVGADSTAKALTLKLGMDKVGDYEKFTKSLKVDAKKDLQKELGKADNRMLLYCILCVIALFMVSYIYCEIIQKPTANRMAIMIKCGLFDRTWRQRRPEGYGYYWCGFDCEWFNF